MSHKNEYHIPVELEDTTAVELLANNNTNLSRQKIKQVMQKGCVWLEKDKYIQRLRRAKKTLSQGDILHFYYAPEILDTVPPEATLISDVGDYSIWNKPSGMLSQGSKWGDHCTINRWAEKHLKPERPAFIVHRLDRAARGLILLAHKKKVATQFAQMFKDREIEKHYQVEVEGDFISATLDNEKTKTISTKIGNKMATSHVRLIKYNKELDVSLLNVQIETGRKHQIRIHLSGFGFPVVGDRLYGSRKSAKDLQLAAILLKFKCPVTGEMQCFTL